MLPASTNERTNREVNRGRPGGRTQEIQRLIGRSLRSVTDLSRLGERTITIDCDVLQADAGTRTASITGGYIALAMALRDLAAAGQIPDDLLTDSVAAVSVGIVEGEARLDLCYDEDAGADVDFNVVMTGSGEFVEVQGTAEGTPFSRAQLDGLLDLAAARHHRPHDDPAAKRSRAEPASWPSPTALAIASRNAHKLRELGRICARLAGRLGHGREPRPRRVPRRGGDGRHLPRERAAEGARGRRGARRAGDRRRFRASRSTRWAASPGRARRGTRGRTPPTSRTSRP